MLDHSFNDLAAYDDTIENYIKVTKELQKNKEPVIFLVYFPQLPKNPHPDTKQSIPFKYPICLVITLRKKEEMESKEFHLKGKKSMLELNDVLKGICGGLSVWQNSTTYRNIKNMTRKRATNLRTRAFCAKNRLITFTLSSCLSCAL